MEQQIADRLYAQAAELSLGRPAHSLKHGDRVLELPRVQVLLGDMGRPQTTRPEQGDRS